MSGRRLLDLCFKSSYIFNILFIRRKCLEKGGDPVLSLGISLAGLSVVIAVIEAILDRSPRYATQKVK